MPRKTKKTSSGKLGVISPVTHKTCFSTTCTLATLVSVILFLGYLSNRAPSLKDAPYAPGECFTYTDDNIYAQINSFETTTFDEQSVNYTFVSVEKHNMAAIDLDITGDAKRPLDEFKNLYPTHVNCSFYYRNMITLLKRKLQKLETKK